MTLFDRIMLKFSFVVLACVFVSLLFVIFVSVYPFKTLDVKFPIQILNEGRIIQRGTDLVYRTHYMKHINSPAHVSRQIQDGWIYTYADTYSNIPSGEHIIYMSAPIPENTPPGKYKLVMTVTYELFGLRKITKTFNSEYFDVVREDQYKEAINEYRCLTK